MPRKTKREIALEAQRKHERLCQKAQAERGRDGVTKLRIMTYNALHERMRKELKAKMV